MLSGSHFHGVRRPSSIRSAVEAGTLRGGFWLSQEERSVCG